MGTGKRLPQAILNDLVLFERLDVLRYAAFDAMPPLRFLHAAEKLSKQGP